MQTMIITGASDGIGFAAAKQLKSKGHNVVIVGRSKTKTEAAARQLSVPYHLADYCSLAEVKRLAQELSIYDRIEVLANNAGGIMGPRELTVDGFEKTFQVNHLAPFLLTKLLLDKLIKSSSKVIQTTSLAANLWGKNFNINDLNSEFNYSPESAYGIGKLENILFTKELDRRYRSFGISAVAFHPGIVRTSFANDTSHFMRFFYHSFLKYFFTISPEKSATALTELAEGHLGKTELSWQPGQVYYKHKPMPVTFKDDGSIAKDLWTKSEELLKPWLA